MPSIRNILPGEPEPLGPTILPEGINFAVHASGATRLELLLFDNVTDERPSQVIPLDPEKHKTGGVWHVFVEGLRPGVHYAWRLDGPNDPRSGLLFDKRREISDPWARAVTDVRWNRALACSPDGHSRA